MFQFPGFASQPYEFRLRYPRKGGFPHSDIFGSKSARDSPKLFAACHVLHRLSVPRHPPDALRRLISAKPFRRPRAEANPRHPEHLERHLTARSEEHTSELQSLTRIPNAVFCLIKKHITNSTTDDMTY